MTDMEMRLRAMLGYVAPDRPVLDAVRDVLTVNERLQKANAELRRQLLTLQPLPERPLDDSWTRGT